MRVLTALLLGYGTLSACTDSDISRSKLDDKLPTTPRLRVDTETGMVVRSDWPEPEARLHRDLLASLKHAEALSQRKAEIFGDDVGPLDYSVIKLRAVIAENPHDLQQSTRQVTEYIAHANLLIAGAGSPDALPGKIQLPPVDDDRLLDNWSQVTVGMGWRRVLVVLGGPDFGSRWTVDGYPTHFFYSARYEGFSASVRFSSGVVVSVEASYSD